jgi:integrase/recombinase XerC
MFLSYIQHERRGSPHTLVAYRTDLEQYVSFLFSQNQSIEQATHRNIRSWQIALMEDNDTARTINRKLSTLKAFYRFMLRNKYLTTNPMEKVISPKQSKKLTQFVSEQDMDTVFEYLEFSDDFEGKRDKTILELFYATGIRLSELMQVKKGDLDFYSGTIKIFGKRKKERIIPITPQIVALLQEISERGTAVVMSTHNYAIVQAFSGRIVKCENMQLIELN